MAEVQKISGSIGNFDVSIKINPRYVTDNADNLRACAEVCKMEIDNPFNYGMDKMKAVYLPHEMAFPMRWVVDPALVKSDEAKAIEAACPDGGLDLSAAAKTVELKVGAIVWATGWAPYDANKIEQYNYAKNQNVITNVMMERLASLNGPTHGQILRPSDNKLPQTVAFVQCAGSRDENHLGFCSGICCLASLKQATYVREKCPDARIIIFYIDIRATDRLEDFYTKVKQDKTIEFFKGKVAEITEDPNTKNPILKVENTMTGALSEIPVDLAVLATGMQPNTSTTKIPVSDKVRYDDYGFVEAESGVPGIIAAGTIRTPAGVSEAVADGTAAALKAIQAISRR